MNLHPSPRAAHTLLRIVLAALLVAPAAGGAQDDPVAHAGAVTGAVSVQHGSGTAPGGLATGNPVVSGDRIVTAADAAAELLFDATTTAKLAGDVHLRIRHDDPDEHDLQLASGTIAIVIAQHDPGWVSITTPSVEIRPRTAGLYRISVTDGTTVVTVRRGRAVVVTPQEARPLLAGNTLAASGPRTEPVLGWHAVPPADQLDAEQHPSADPLAADH
jgi:hypothetical protein